MNTNVRSNSPLIQQLRFFDALLLVFSLPMLAGIYGVPFDQDYLWLTAFSWLLFMGYSRFAKIYGDWRLQTLWVQLRHLFLVWSGVLITLTFLGFAFKITATYSRFLLGTWALFVPFSLGLLRLLMRYRALEEARRGQNVQVLAFVGGGATSRRMAEQLALSDWMGLRVAGVYDDRKVARVSLGPLSLIGGTEDMLRNARAGKLDYVYITLPMHAEKRIMALVDALADTTVSVSVVPDAFLFDMMAARWNVVAGHPVISVYESPFSGVDGSLKRLEDVLVGFLILLLISPLLLVIAVLIKLSSPGPVLFRQRRYGLNGQVVEVWKFRSMTVCDDGDLVIQARRGDGRVTPLGGFLRRTSLDELPQFFNVLQGRMSIVGPRPHAIAHNEQYRGLIHGYMLRHKVKPGITGWAQVNGWRGETDTLDKMKQRVECDLYYVRNWSLLLDLRIILLTVFKGFVGKNVY